MSSSKHLLLAILAGVTVVAAGWLVDVWPVYRKVEATRKQAEEFRDKRDGVILPPERIKAVEDELGQVDRRIADEMRPIPPEADLGELQRLLYVREDGTSVLNLDFDTGDARPAVPGYDVMFMAAPLTVQMTARFRKIFALIEGAETNSEHFLRVKAVKINARRDDELGAMAVATIELDVIYEPPESENGGP